MYGSKWFNEVVYVTVGRDILAYHGYVIIVAVLVLGVILYIGVVVFLRKITYRHFLNKQNLEFWYTIIPIVLMGMLWVPSQLNLYHIDDVKTPRWNFKAFGKQWYWSYEFIADTSLQRVVLDSYIKSWEPGEKVEGYRLLDVDQRIVAPSNVQLTCFVRSTDVLHSFALPSVLLKIDAIPGRINRLPMVVREACVLYGQCSEICGVNHRFMPIVVEFIPEWKFVEWLGEVSKELA